MNRKAYTPEDFAWVQWTPEIIKQKTQEAIEAKKARYAEIKSIAPEERTFENTIFAIEASEYGHVDDIHRFELLMSVSPSDEIRSVATEAVESIQQAMVDIEYDEGMYLSAQEYAAKNEILEGADKRLFDDTIRAYKRMGFTLEPAKRQQLKDNLKEMSELSTGFEKAIADYQDHIVVQLDELKGLPDAYINNLKRDEDRNYIVSLIYPEFIPFMERCEFGPRRKELIDKSLRKGGLANVERLKRILELRAENANLLGYPSHAAYQIEERMAKTVDAVNLFLKDMSDRVMQSARFDLQLLDELKKKDLGDESARLAYYDIAYYIQKDKMQGYAVDDEVIREYLPLDAVMKALFELYSTVLGLSFAKEDFPIWHDDSEWYRVDETDGSLKGYFALDLFPRKGKFSHAAHFVGAQGRASGDEYIAPISVIVANFNRPSDGMPALLSHDEVQTLFHEFGHAMHSLITTAAYASQAGTSVDRDFVEAPSQMFEYWMWEKSLLKNMSKHYKTGESLPDELIDQLIKSKNHMTGFSLIRQILMGMFDMAIHTSTEEADPVRVYGELYREMTGIVTFDGQLWPAGFGHLVGYDAGYYGYLWSEVYAADMFTRFRGEGVINPKVGMDYRKKILEVGSSRDEMESVIDFLGRKPNNEAFLKDMGLASRDEKGEEASE